MKNLFGSKLNRQPRNMLLYTLMCIGCFVLSATIAFGCCYAYFSAKINGSGEVTSGLLKLEYLAPNGVNATEDLTIYISRDNVDWEDDYTKLISTDDSGDFYTYFMPGDRILVTGSVRNPQDSITAYVLLKIEIFVHEGELADNATANDTLWFNLTGEQIVLQNNQVTNTSPVATTLNANASATLPVTDTIISDDFDGYIADDTDAVSCILLGENEIDNSVTNNNVTIKLTVCGFQGESLDNSLTAKDVTNQIING